MVPSDVKSSKNAILVKGPAPGGLGVEAVVGETPLGTIGMHACALPPSRLYAASATAAFKSLRRCKIIPRTCICVTDAHLHYHGSITLDPDHCEEAGILPLEFVEIWNKSSGARMSTYVIFVGCRRRQFRRNCSWLTRFPCCRAARWISWRSKRSPMRQPNIRPNLSRCL